MKRFVVYYEDKFGLYKNTESFDKHEQAKEMLEDLIQSGNHSNVEIIDQEEFVWS